MTMTHGDPDGMLAAANRVYGPQLDGAVDRYPTKACGGLDECQGLFQADLASTNQLQTFLTEVSQGFTAFHDLIRDCAALYRDGREASTEQLTAVLSQPADPTLPTRDPVFQTPHPLPGN